tara:strand:- start:268 stop:471 length:204 start_codon:yes stop_codon:yes gene_type:complete
MSDRGITPAGKKGAGTVRIPVIPYTGNGNGNGNGNGDKRHNPFKGQKIKKGGKWVDRTPENSTGGQP